MESNEATTGQPAETESRLPTRLTRRGAERCSRIRAVAADLFLTRGFEGVSLDDIILQAGGSKTNIYNHFGDKERLFLTVIEELLDLATEPLRALDLSDCDFEEGLIRFGHTLLGILLDERHLAVYRLVIGESARFPSLSTVWLNHGPEVSISVLTDFLSRCQAASGRPGTVSARRAASLFHDMLVHDRLLAFGLDRPRTDEAIARLIREATLVFTRGYLPANPSAKSLT